MMCTLKTVKIQDLGVEEMTQQLKALGDFEDLSLVTSIHTATHSL